MRKNRRKKLWDVQNAAVRTVRSSHPCTRKEKIFRHLKDAADGCLPGLWEFCAVFAQRENRLIQNHIGCVTHAGKSGQYKQKWPDMDVIHEDVQKDFRVPSDAGEKFLFRKFPVPAVRQMHRDCNRAFAWHFYFCISPGFVHESFGYNTPHDRRNHAGNHFLWINQREKIMYRDSVRFRNDEHSYQGDLLYHGLGKGQD